MGSHYLNRLFAPESVAVIGASDREHSVGAQVFRNLITARFKGGLYAVNPKHQRVQRRKSHPNIEAIGKPVDLAIVATPARAVPEVIRECGEYGVHSAVILSAGFAEAGSEGRRLQAATVEAAQLHGLRLIGPNCLGIMRPDIGLNATFSHNQALPGNLALVSQSGALSTAILDWAEGRQIGFSSVVSLGDAADIDFGQILDFLALDPKTRSILLYVEGIRRGRRFMSGLRAAARMKPVVVIKAGRYAEGSRAAMSHTGAIVGADDVFDAALGRAGAVRVMTINQLFSAAQILSSNVTVREGRLAIVTNGGGPGVLATDRAVELGVKVPQPNAETMKQLDEALPRHWSHANPVDILGDAEPERYAKAVSACLKDTAFDGLLTILTPQAMTDPTAAAEAVVKAAAKSRKPVLSCWMGDAQVAEARALFLKKRIPHFPTPEAAVAAFANLATYNRNQQLLIQVPGPLEDRSAPDAEGARLIIEGVLAEGRHTLSHLESKAVLSAFRIPVVHTIEARTSAEALVAAQSVGFPVAMKISSPQVMHKSDVGGVRLNVSNAHAVRSVFQQMMEEVKSLKPDAQISGITIEPMYKTGSGRELMVGVVRDPVFGPVISFGAGGTSVEIMRDRSVALPPLNEFIIRNMIGRTRIARLLDRYRHLPPVDMAALEDVLLRVSDLVCELPHVREIDINPLIADPSGVVAVDARISVDFVQPAQDRYGHMAIHPYPSDLVSSYQLGDGTNVTMRPMRPEDAAIEADFVHNLSDESKYFRFMQAMHELTPEMLVRFTQIDYIREMAFIAVTEVGGRETQIGVARYTVNPDGETCEFAIVVADDWHKRGIGSQLMHRLLDTAKSRGLKIMEGEVLANNRNMLQLIENLGFATHPDPEDPTVVTVRRVI
jgi:acetyltransferase